MVGKLVVIPGILTAVSKPVVKATKVCVQCKNCGHFKEIFVHKGIGGTILPRVCDNSNNPGQGREKCPVDPYFIVPEKCIYMNHQTMKIQESPESVSTGEIPRTYIMSCDRYLVDKAAPGNRVKIVGIYNVFSSTKKGTRSISPDSIVKTSYVQILGMEIEQMGHHIKAAQLSEKDEERIQSLAKDKDLFNKIQKSIASAIYGHDEIKMAIACLLFGGSSKMLPDKTKLRGDINILLLGDPSTAKSQLLKFVERVAPISVYTSGKGSSAAGLTASVLKDPTTGEFQLEGGAMVLADGGVVCIDEFDKMRSQDRVAIHEAMEQQTISIAKAGITTILNSRTSVIAAANPTYGRYDDLKMASEQIEFQSTILSRFDCIFIVRDLRNPQVDEKIAEHVVNMHMSGEAMEVEGEISLEDLKKYIIYAKSKISPRLSEESSKILENMYVNDRQAVNTQLKASKNNGIPITVRQLEAIIRISESFAKMQLSTIVTKEHVQKAHELFKVSTLSAAGIGQGIGVDIPHELGQLVAKIEDAILKRVAINNKIAQSRLVEDMLARFPNQKAVELAILNLIKRDQFASKEGRKILERKR